MKIAVLAKAERWSSARVKGVRARVCVRERERGKGVFFDFVVLIVPDKTTRKYAAPKSILGANGERICGEF